MRFGGAIADESIHDPDRGFACGYYMETIALGPALTSAFVKPGARGSDYASLMDRCISPAGLWIKGEGLPDLSNRITLNTGTYAMRYYGI